MKIYFLILKIFTISRLLSVTEDPQLLLSIGPTGVDIIRITDQSDITPYFYIQINDIESEEFKNMGEIDHRTAVEIRNSFNQLLCSRNNTDVELCSYSLQAETTWYIEKMGQLIRFRTESGLCLSKDDQVPPGSKVYSLILKECIDRSTGLFTII